MRSDTGRSNAGSSLEKWLVIKPTRTPDVAWVSVWMNYEQNMYNSQRQSLLSSFQFSFNCKKRDKTITLANHTGHRQPSEPIKTQRRYIKLTRSAGKRVPATCHRDAAISQSRKCKTKANTDYYLRSSKKTGLWTELSRTETKHRNVQ